MTLIQRVSKMKNNFWNFVLLKRFRLNLFIKSKPYLFKEYPRYISNIQQVHQYIDYLEEEDDVIRISNPPYSYNPFFYHSFKVIIKKEGELYRITDQLAYPDFDAKVDREKLLGFLRDNSTFLSILYEPSDLDKYVSGGVGIRSGFQNKSDIKDTNSLFDFNAPQNAFGLLLSIKSETTSMHISNITDAKVYLTYLMDEEDYLNITVVDDDLLYHTIITVKRLKNHYLLRYSRGFPELILEINREKLTTLFSDNKTFMRVIDKPKVFGFDSKKGFSFTNRDGKHVPLIEESFEECISEVRNLKNEGITYIYDEETSTRFAIYREKDVIFTLEMFMGDICYIETTQEKLIELLDNDISIFKKMQENREAFGFECGSI